jgi:hypothetical protein
MKLLEDKPQYLVSIIGYGPQGSIHGWNSVILIFITTMKPTQILAS